MGNLHNDENEDYCEKENRDHEDSALFELNKE
jgi:hypothetical protein